ncbi:MAG: carbon starvation protein A [Verrucomicrobia bacterium]|nr:carbon starvation protein A [Verrucomicrobiota bacterium]
MLIFIFIGGCILFALAYRWYGAFLAREMKLDDARPTPAHTQRDGVDYAPTPNAVLFGHHFSSIAGAGPIVGPILAGMAFGWLPAALWIVIGSIFVGGVHDFTAMVLSVRHGSRSVGQICRTLVNPFTYYMFLLFVLFALVYVVIVFLDLTASSFVPVTAEAMVNDATRLAAKQGGVVATASLTYVVLALLYGFATNRLRMPVWAASLVFVPLIFGGLWIGEMFPLTVDHLPSLFGSVKNFWCVILLLYCLLASILPVWILLQPRDYLSSYLLYACLGAGGLGLLVAGATGQAPVQYPAFLGWHDAQLGYLFPALFITIACGAVSGFHSIVSSGTSAKQLRNESAARVIGYGSMLVEGVLALLSLAAVMLLAGKSSQTPIQTFANGIGHFVSVLGLPSSLGTTFGMLAVSTFILTTLDTCTRLARFLLQELLGLSSRLLPRICATLAVMIVPAFVVFQEIPGPNGVLIPAWKAIWPAFGASNQLLAALALVVVFTWLRRNGRRCWYVGIPMIFMCFTTVTALAQLAWLNMRGAGSAFVGWVSLVLLVLALVVIGNAAWVLTRRLTPPTAPPPGA